MDIDVGPNAPGSNFSRLERHSADRRIGPASLNHHPNRLCGRQTDEDEVISLRLRNAAREDACLPRYQYCLVSSDRETDYAAFAALLKCQSMRVALMRE